MGLFKIPKREEVDIHNILAKSREEIKPKITIKGSGETLLTKLAAIKEDVKRNLGKEVDNYLCITSDDEFIQYCKQAVEDGVVAIDTETDSLDSIKAHLVGVCLYSRSQKSAYIPVGHISAITETKVSPQVSIEAITEGMKILKRAKCVFHNGYYDRVIIYQNTGILLDVFDDTLIMAWYLNENEPHGLKYLYNKYVADGKNGVHTFSELFEGIPFCYIPYNVGYIYGAFDAYMTYYLYMFFKPFLTLDAPECVENNLQRVAKVYEDVEKPLMDVLIKMKIQGVRFDFDRAKELRVKYTNLKLDAEKEFHKAVSVYEKEIKDRQYIKQDIDYPINYNSPQQISILFYDIIKTGVIFKKEPKGTGKHVIEEILNNKKYSNTPLFNIAQTLQEVKKYDKLISSFIDKLSENAQEHNGRIFCDFNQVGANTLRMSSSNPNLQQVPSRNSDIRNMFVPEKDCVFVNLDFSQQEMMAVASLADDEKMLESFHLGRDIYSHVASIAFNVPYEDCLEFYSDGTVNKEGKVRRKKSKAICLGICYGKGVPAIAEDLHISIELAQQIKDSILKAFPKLAQYLEDVVEFGKEHGYVENYFGVKRRLPELQLEDYTFSFGNDVAENTKKYYKALYSGKLKKAKYMSEINKIIANAKNKGINIYSNHNSIAQAIRNAYNSPVQSTAAILTKIAMNNIDRNKDLQEMGVKLVLTIHDEVALNVPKRYLKQAIEIAKKEFLDAGKDLKADLRCDIEIAKCWAGESIYC